MPKLTETYISKLAYASDGTEKYWDSEIKGLVVFVGKRSKTWYFQKDVGGKTKRIMIGRHPAITSKAARESALSLSLEMARGVGKLLHRAVPTLGQAAQVYVTRPKLRSEEYKAGVTRQFELYLSDWLNLPLNEVTKTMVVQRHYEMRSTPVNANRVLRMFRSVWNHTRRTVDLNECPTNAIEWFKEKPDLRVIDDLCEWRAAVEALDSPIHQTFYKMALFTGLRKSELLKLEWSNVRDDHIHIPMTKNGRSFDLPITEDHHQILGRVKGLNLSWVFPSSKSNVGHITNPTRLVWSIHSHRRTFATVAVEAGVLEEIVGRLLNHTPASVTGQRYARPRLDALRPSMEWICREIKARTKMNHGFTS